MTRAAAGPPPRNARAQVMTAIAPDAEISPAAIARALAFVLANGAALDRTAGGHWVPLGTGAFWPGAPHLPARDVYALKRAGLLQIRWNGPHARAVLTEKGRDASLGATASTVSPATPADAAKRDAGEVHQQFF